MQALKLISYCQATLTSFEAVGDDRTAALRGFFPCFPVPLLLGTRLDALSDCGSTLRRSTVSGDRCGRYHGDRCY